jgi:hypothetical protein
MKKAIFAAVVGGTLLFTSSIASAQLCAVGIIGAAIIANTSEHRALTEKEAWTCGLLLGQDKPEPKVKAKKVVYHRHKNKKKH